MHTPSMLLLPTSAPGTFSNFRSSLVSNVPVDPLVSNVPVDTPKMQPPVAAPIQDRLRLHPVHPEILFILFRQWRLSCSEQDLRGLQDRQDLSRLLVSKVGFRQEFVLRDHLGNARVHFSDLNGDGALQPFACNPGIPCVPLGNGGGYTEMLQVQHYYPFGMEFDGPWEMPLDPDEINHYTYNGKELNRDFGLGWLDYGARWYDAVTARWGQVDPLAADFAAWSSYSYSFNNPIRFIDPDGRAPDDPPIGFSQLSYTLHHNYSHTVSYHKELSTKEGNTVTRTVIDETITLSNRGEVLSTNRSTVTSQAEITGERTVSNPLDGMEVTTNVLGEFEEVSSIQDQDLAVENLSSDLQGVVGTIQENTEFNQRYDYIKEDAAEENFIISVAYGTGAFLSKAAPASVKYAGGLIAAGAAYHNSTRDNRGRTVNTLPKVETQ
jgi:RHS repeat-associated protein